MAIPRALALSTFFLLLSTGLPHAHVPAPPELVAQPAAEPCVFSQGYWKNHAERWPVAALVLGDPGFAAHAYTQGQLLALLGTPARGDASIILAIQLIAAKLNVANGSSPQPVAAALARADALFGAIRKRLPYGITTSTPMGTDMVATAAILELYNTGQLPGSCGTTNTAPVANAGPDQRVVFGSVVTLDGSASFDVDGHALRYEWSFLSRPPASAAVLSDPASVRPVFTADEPGTYQLQLIVSDGFVASAPSMVQVSTENVRPVANAGADQTAPVTTTVRLDGSGSNDVDGNPLTFSWRLALKPADSQAVIENPGAVDPSLTIDAAGEYEVELVVSDGALESVPDTVRISTVNSAPDANAGADATGVNGATITLDGGGSTDVDGDALTYRWTLLTVPTGSAAALTNPTTVAPSFVIDITGEYVAQLIVHDGHVDSDADTVTITTLNTRPIANAGADQSLTIGDVAHLDGTASSDVDGDALTYEWSLTTRPPGSATAFDDHTVARPTFMPDIPGLYVAQLIARDAASPSDPDTTLIFVADAPVNQPPVAEAGPPQTVPLGGLATLDGSASSDPEGGALAYRWSLSPPAGSTAALSDPASPQPTFTADRPGSYVAQLIVNDGALDSTPDTVSISTLNSVPVANAGVDRGVATGAPVTLDGSASFDADGTPLTFAWSLTRPDGSNAVLSDPSAIDPSFAADVDGVYVAQLIVSDGTLTSAPDTAAITAGPGADLDVAFFRAPPNPPVGVPDDWGIQVLNFGPQNPVAVDVSMPVPSGYSFVESSATAGAYNPATGIWTIPALDFIAGLRLRLHPLAAGDHDVTATVISSSAPDPNPDNNSVTAIATADPTVDLQLSFFNQAPGTRSPGEEIVIVIDLNNRGPAAAADTAVEIPIPAGFTIVSVTPQIGAYDSATGLWSIGHFPPFNRTSITLRLRLNADGPIDLRLVATSPSPDSNPADNVVVIPRNNRIPIANAGVDQSVSTHVLVTLDGRASFDPDGDPITFEWVSAVRPINSNGTIANATTPSPSFTPDLPGAYVAQLIVRDNQGTASVPDTATISAEVTNTAPAFVSTPITSASTGQPYQYDVNATDPDAADVLQFSLTTAPAGMSIHPQTGLIEWLPGDAQGGPAPVVVRVQDAASFAATQSFTIQVSSPGNGAPLAADDAYSTRIGESLGVPAPGVTANDADATPLSVRLATPPGNGAMLFNSDGSFTYTPHTMQPGEFVRVENINLTSRLPGTTWTGGDCPHCAADENIHTDWDSRGNVLLVTFPSDVQVSRVDAIGERNSNKPSIAAARLVLESSAGATLFDSGNVTLPAPDHDGSFAIPDVPGVRRVRFIPDPGSNFFAALAELRVIGSGLMQRTPFVEPNLVQLLPVTVAANTAFGVHVPEGLADDNPATSWYTAATPGDFVEVAFPLPVTVRQLIGANPHGRPDGFFTSDPLACSGTFTLLDANGAVLFDTGIVNEPTGSHIGSDTFALSFPDIAGVRKVRYTLSSCTAGYGLGFAGWQVLGTAPVSMPALGMSEKLQSLQGREAHSTPIVINLTDDNGDGQIDANDVPDIAVPVEAGADQLRGEIRVISGDDGRLLFTAGGPTLVSPWAELAAGDLDGDGRPEILAVGAGGDRLLAFGHDGTLKWESVAHAMPSAVIDASVVATGAISIANLDAAGAPEIIVGASVFDANGQLLGDGRTLGGTTGGTGLRSAISAVADIDLDGMPELVAGPTAYRLDSGALAIAWQRADRPDGYVGIANLDDDPQAEIVSVANGVVYALNHDGSDFQPWNAPTHAPLPIPGGGQGGAPLVVDVDGDGRPEIGVAGSANLVVFNRDGQVRWQAPISDRTSNSTGAIAFDLNGDGDVEIIYRDERFLRIYRGADGVLLLKAPVGSATWSEEPVVADVDNDGHADIVVSSDLFAQSAGDTGILVFQDVANRWSRTRRIWNQHAYHVTNVGEDGSIPVAESAHWLSSGLNAFRTNAFIAGESADASDSFTYVASDGTLESNAATVRIALRAPNAQPRFTSQPIAAAAPAVAYRYAAQAEDPDGGDILAFSLSSGPEGMSIDPQSGLIEWTPEAAQGGSHDVVVKVADLRGLFALQSYSIEVAAARTVPAIEGQPAATADALVAGAGLTVGEVTSRHSASTAEGSVVSQHPAAGTLAAPGAPVNYVVSLGPPPTGIVPAVIGLTQANAELDVAAAGFSSAISSHSSSVTPAGVVLAQTPAAGTILPAGSAVAFVVSTGPPPGELDLDGDGFTGDQGDCRDDDPLVHPNAFDIPGDGIDQNCNGVDSVAGDDTAPTAALVSPADLADITTPTDIVGTVADVNFHRYTVQLSEVDSATFTVIGSGTAPVTAGAVATLDPTLLENGLYRVRLIAEDVNGQTAVDERVYRVDGAAKVGHFRLSFTDVSMPVAGIPVTVTRTYDSRVKTREDFGIGWSLDVSSGSYRHNRRPGEGWVILDQPILGSFLPCVGGTIETRTHLTEVRLSDRESYRFALEIRSPNLGIANACEGVASFRFVDGTRPGATLDILDSNAILYFRGGEDVAVDRVAFLEDGTLRPYDPRHVRLALPDGTTIDFERQRGVTRIGDLNGNSLQITPHGIVHSSGRSISFTRDEQQRIAGITDARGQALTYTYDDAGDLRTFTDQNGAQTRFAYDADHRLVEITDALGRVSRSEFDAAGRLTAVVDPSGDRMTFDHDLDTRTETITDRLGGVTSLEYDERGNVLRRTDARGQLTSFTYDARDNQLSETNPLGHTRTSTYDARDNVLTEIDALGQTTTFTYTDRNRLLTRTDARGGIRQLAYDSRDNVLAETDATGAVTRHSYDAQGRRVQTVDPTGATWRYAYDAAGNVIQAVSPTGQVRGTTRDASGNVLRETLRGPVDTAAEAVTSFFYDAQNRRTSSTDASGATTSLAYTPTGQVASETDEAGSVTVTTYDAEERPVRITYADGLFEAMEYDVEGRRTALTDRAGRTTRYTYDAVGALLTTTHPDGAVEQIEYDEAGRVIATTDPLGRRSTHTYDAAGQRLSTRDPLGHVTTMVYDPNGNLATTTDPPGNVTTYTYDAENRPIGTTYADGTSSAEAYDAAGRRSSVTDPAGNVTRYEYDGRGALLRVIDPLGAVTAYSYDEANRRTAQTDALGNTTRFAYDGGRLVQTTLPLGQVDARSYDAAGRLAGRRDFNGQLTTFSYDAMSRLTARVLPGGETHAFTYTPMGLVASMTDATGTTTFEYDLRDRPARVRRPDGAAVTYAYDAAGNRTGVSTPGGAVTYTYDAGDRLVSLLDPQGLTSTFGYDAAGNVTTVNHANGIESRSEFDSRNRLTQITHAQGATTLRAFQYTFGAAGNRTRVVEDSGRTVDYAYDSLFRLTGETVTLPGQAPSTVSYAYDAAGNRISQAGPNGSTTFVYDANSRLLQAAGKVFTYDGNGNQLTQQDATGLTSYAYDGLNRLVSAASGGTLTHYAYNAMGHRVRKTTAGASIDYLVDPFGRDGLSQVLRETTPSSAIDYTIAGGTLHSMHGAGGTSFYLADGRRSTRMLADVAGAVTDRYDYDGFGNVLARQGATANEYLFDGQRLDGALRQYDLRARIYDPLSGRFSARDPFEGVLLDPGSLHPYTYAHNDPINRSDPGGQFTLLEQMTISAAVGIYAGLGFAAQNFYYYRSAELAFDAGVDAALSFGAFTMDMLGLGSLFRALGAKIVTSVASTFGTKTLISQTTKGEVVPTVVKRTADAVERVAAHHGPTIPPASTVAAMDPARRAMVERALAAVPRTSTPTMEQWLRSLSRETLVEASQVVVVGTHAGVRTVTKYAVRVGIWF